MKFFFPTRATVRNGQRYSAFVSRGRSILAHLKISMASLFSTFQPCVVTQNVHLITSSIVSLALFLVWIFVQDRDSSFQKKEVSYTKGSSFRRGVFAAAVNS